MRKVKQIGSLALAVIMLLAMIGCGHVDPDTTVPPEPSGTNSLQGQVTAPTDGSTAPSSTPTDSDPTTLPTDPRDPSGPEDPPSPTEPATSPTAPRETQPSEPVPTTEPPSAAPEPTVPAGSEHTHRYTDTVVAATCSAKGYTRHTCSCGHSYDDNGTPVDPDAHSYTQHVRQPTCALDGVTYYVCSGCGDRYLDDSTFVPPLAHTKQGDPVRMVPATEEERGYSVYVCAVCSKQFHADFVEYQPHEHTHSTPAIRTVAPTMWDQGYTVYQCSICGNEYPADFTPPDEAAMQAFLQEAAAYTVQYINQYRVEQGGTAAEVLPGLTQVAEYRAVQLLDNYSHDEHALREATAFYKYGEYVDLTQYGYDESYNYYTFGGAEAIAKSNRVQPSTEVLGKAFATAARDSAGHWRYVGASKNCYIAVAIEYDADAVDGFPWKCCILLTDTNYG